MDKPIRNIVFILFAFFGIFSFIYHSIGIFYPVNTSPVWRHIVFMVISFICIYGLLKRPRWFAWFFFVLLLQQLYSHGGDIAWHWKHRHHIDWISVAVVTIMPVVFLLLVADQRKQS
jgi:hypothetical protein